VLLNKRKALRESEQKYRTLVETIPMKVFHKDRNSIYVSCNDLYAKDLRIPATEIAGRTDYDFYPKSLAEKYRADDQRIMESGETEQIEEDYIESGEHRTVLTVKTPIRDERGNVTGVLGIFTDITERKKGEERLRVAAESLSDVIYEWDLKDWLDWFGKIDELLGYAPNEFPRTLAAWVELLHPQDRDAVMAAIDRHLKTGAPYDIEYRVKRKDGTWRYWLARGRALRDAQSVPYKWIGAISDITERKQAEEEHKTILRTAIDGFWVVDTQGRFLDVNDAYCRLIGYSRDELLKMSIPDVEAIERPEETAQRIQKIMTVGGDRFETRHKCKDGKIIDIEVSVNYARERTERFFVFLRDITERKKAEEALRESEEKYRLLAQNTMDVISRHTIEDEIVYISPAVEDLLGIKPEELFGEKAFELIHPDDMHIVEQARKTTRESGSAIGVQFRMRHKKGHYVWVETSSNLILDPSTGMPLEVVNVTRNITERKKGEEALRESEKHFRDLTDSIADVFFAMNRDFRYTHWNKASERLTGIEARDALGKCLYELFPDFKGTEADTIYRESLQIQQPMSFLNKYKINNKEFFFDLTVYPFKDGLAVLARDVSEIKKAEEALRESEERFRSLIESTSDWLWQADENTVYTYASPKVKEILGYEPEEILGKTPFDLMPADEAKRVAAEFESIVKGQKAFNRLENVNLHKDGRLVVLETSGVPVFDEGGNFRGYRGIDRDITERKQAEKEKEELQAQLMQSAKMAAVGQLAGGIAHEINNPLTVILGFAEGSAKRLAPGDTLEMPIKSIEREAIRCGKLVRDLLVFSRSQKAGPEELDVVKTIENTMSLISARAKNSNIKLVRAFGKNIPHIFANSNQLQQAIINLANNAFDAMGERGILTIRACSLEENGKRGAEIQIEDTGTGIPEEIRSRIFEPFFTTKEAGKGTGLGLGLCYEIVKKAGGDIHFTTELGKGTCFTVRLPAADGGANAK
jgi:PAS domain S-box-containing protein